MGKQQTNPQGVNMINRILSITLLFSIIIGSVTDLVAQRKNTDELSIDQRLAKHLPIFQDPSCTKYLIEFGSNDKAVKSASKSIGIQYFSKAPIPQVEDAYMFLYSDPENITRKDGVQVSNTVLYIFSFMPDGEYFSFSSNIIFKTTKQAKEAYQYLTNIIGGSESESDDSFSTMVECSDKKSPMRGSRRMVTVKREGLSVTFITMDYDILEKYVMRGEAGS
jgi:hypothetical protein